MHTAALSLLAAALLGGPSGEAEPSSNASRAMVPHCQVFLIKDVEVPAQETGLLVTVNAREGDTVQKEELVAQIDDRSAQLEKRAAELERDTALARADDDIEVQYAEKSAALAEAELKESLDINRRSKRVVPLSEIRRQRLAKDRAELQIDRSRLELRIAQMDADVQGAAVEAAEDKILRRQVLAPFEGMVIDIYRQANEWVNAGEPVLRIVRMDQLYIEGFLRTADFDSSDVDGREVTVEIELAGDRRARFEGQVVFVNPLVQAGNKYRVRAIVDNRQENGHWLLRPGMSATMVVHLQ